MSNGNNNKFRSFVFTHMFLAVALLPWPLLAQEDNYGICIIQNDSVWGVRQNEYFPMHSVMKFPQALYVAYYLERQGIGYDDQILVRRDELDTNTWSPMLTTMGNEKLFSYRELLALSLQQSDNNACDLLFRHCGAPRKVERYLRRLGFSHIVIRKTERQMHATPTLYHTNLATPAEMARLFEWFYQHRDKNGYLQLVWTLMAECRTGLDRLPACLPQGATIVHKTGTGPSTDTGLTDINDAGIFLTSNGLHQTVAIFVCQASNKNSLANIARRHLQQ